MTGDRQLAGKTAIVTGSGRGIGRATALRLATAGAGVVINDLDEAPAREVEAEIKKMGGDAAIVLGSVADPKTAEKLVAAAIERWQRIDILVNNAGVTRDAMLHRMSDEWFGLVHDVIVKGAFYCTRAVAPYMRDAGKKDLASGKRVHRKIVNISSITGIYGAVGNVNYASAKAAVIGLTKAVAKEWAPFLVNCNAIAPGIIETRMTAARQDPKDTTSGGIPAELRDQIVRRMPLGRIGTPDDVAAAVEFLAGPGSDFITATVLEVHGGMEFINVVG